MGQQFQSTRTVLTVAFDEGLCCLHLLEQVRVTDDARRISHFTTRLVEAGDDAHDTALGHVGQVCDLREGLLSA